MKIVEIKAGITVMPDMFNNLTWFGKNTGFTNLKKILVFGGNEGQQRSYGQVAPWKEFGNSIE